MAGGVTFQTTALASPPSGLKVATDQITLNTETEDAQVIKIALGAAGSGTLLGIGQAAMAASLPVVIASDQAAIPASQSGTWNVGTVTTVTGVTTVSTVTSLTQFNGNAIALNTGTRSAGTLRVTIATDDVVPASQSGTWNIGTVTTVTSLTQMNGAAIAMGTGTRSAGTQRVTIATDDIVPASQSGTWNIGTVTTVTGVTTVSTVTSLTQFNGVAIALNTGLRAAGVLRVTQATDDVVHIDDNSSSITVDNGGTFAVQAAGDVAAGSADSGNPVKAGGKYNATRPTLADGNRGDLQLGTRGSLGVSLFAADSTSGVGTGHGTAATALRVELPTDSTGVLAAVTSLTQFNGNAIALNTGTRSAGTLRVTIATDDVVPASQSGTWNIGTVTTVTTVSTLSAISAGSNLIADVGIQPRTTLGFDTFMASGSDGSSILVATAQAVKASAGKVYGYFLYNPEAAPTYVHFYNVASGSVTVGTTNPLVTLAIPAGQAANVMSDIGITFGTAITIAATTTAGGNTAPATGVSAVIFYK